MVLADTMEDLEEREELEAFIREIESTVEGKKRVKYDIDITRDPGESYISTGTSFTTSQRVIKQTGYGVSATVISDPKMEKFAMRQRMINMSDEERAMTGLEIAMTDLEVSNKVRGCISNMLLRDPNKAYRNPVLYAIVGEHVCNKRDKSITKKDITTISHRKINGKDSGLKCEDIFRYLRLMMY